MDQMDSVGLPLHKEYFACAQPQWTNDGLILADSALDFTDLLRHPRPHEFRDRDKCVPISIGMSLDEVERQIFHATLNEYGGNKRDTPAHSQNPVGNLIERRNG